MSKEQNLFKAVAIATQLSPFSFGVQPSVSDGIDWSSVNFNPQKVIVGPPRELSPGGDVYLLYNSPNIHIPPPSSPNPEPSLEVKPVSTMESRRAGVLAIMSEHPELFTKEMMEEVGLYYPIYEAVSAAFSIKGYPPIKWYLGWETQLIESGPKDNESVYDGSTFPYYGLGERNVKLWPTAEIEQEVEAHSLEWLAKLPQWHPDDYREIVGEIYILSTDIYDYEKLGASEAKARLEAFTHYGGSKASGERREKLYQEIERVFG